MNSAIFPEALSRGLSFEKPESENAIKMNDLKRIKNEFLKEFIVRLAVAIHASEGEEEGVKYLKEKLAIGELLEYNFYENGALIFKDDTGYNFFNSFGIELTKNSLGEVSECNFDGKMYSFKDVRGINISH